MNNLSERHSWAKGLFAVSSTPTVTTSLAATSAVVSVSMKAQWRLGIQRSQFA